MRIKVLIVLVIIYILAAFTWLTFSLLNYSNSDFELKNDVLQAGLGACTLKVIEEAKNDNLGRDENVNYYLKQLKISVDTVQLKNYISAKFRDNYVARFTEIQPSKYVVQLGINQTKLKQLMADRIQQRNIWLYQSVLLLILVASGIYGVYYTISSIYRLNKRQNNFLLSVTHEFKTPIAAIRLMLQTTKNPRVKEGKKTELIDNSIENTYRLEELAENMLISMQIENNKYEYSLRDVPLSDLVTEIVNSQGFKGEIKANVEENLIVNGDGFILRMVINNLIENAFKYSNNSPIEVSLSLQGTRKVLVVKDQGIGIDKKDLKNVFKKFYRVQEEETRTTKGTGLGLFIVKEATKRHNGKVSVTANEPKGSVFKIELP